MTNQTLHHGWRCFHCDENFPNTEQGRKDAADHFGADPFHDEPACIMQLDQDNKYWLRQCSELIKELQQYQDDDSPLQRQLAAQSAKHAEQLMRANEQGYAQALADLRKQGVVIPE